MSRRTLSGSTSIVVRRRCGVSPRQPRSLMEAAVRAAGWRKGMKAMEFAAMWCIAADDLERPVANMEEFGEWWGESAATAYRWQESFRLAFPQWETPEPVWRGVWRQARNRVEGRNGAVGAAVLGAMPA